MDRREKEWREARRAVSNPNQKSCYDEKKKYNREKRKADNSKDIGQNFMRQRQHRNDAQTSVEGKVYRQC